MVRLGGIYPPPGCVNTLFSTDLCARCAIAFARQHSRAIMATSTQKLKVLSVSAADSGGGAEKIAMALFEALRNQGHKSWMAVDRMSVVVGKNVSVHVNLGGRRFIQKKKKVRYRAY